MPIILYFPMVQNPPIVIADISRYQAMILPDGTVVSHFDFDKYMTKSRVITLRGSVANAGLDYELEYNLTTCEEKEIYVDELYHFTKLWKDLNSQAAYIKDAFDIAKSLAPNYYLNRLSLDIETNDGLDKNTFTGNAEKLASKVYNLTSVIPSIYTRAYFWNANTYMASWMKDCPLWDAHHFLGMNPYGIPIARPYGPDAWYKINNPIPPFKWQFDTHDLGADWGSTGDNEIDLNFFTYNGGTKQAFEEFYGVPYLEPILPSQPQEEDWRRMNVDGMSFRNAPILSSSTLVGRGIKDKRVKIIGDVVNGYVPAEIWLYEASLIKE